MHDVLGLGLIAGSSWTLGAVFPAPFNLPALLAYERAALRLLLGLGLTALVLSLLALAGSFFAAPAVLGAITAIGFVVVATDTGRVRTQAVAQVTTASWAIGLGGVAIFATMAIACAGAAAPVTDDDALAYVIPIARHIAQSGRLTVWSDQARSMWPLSQQVLLAFLLHVGGERLGLLTAFECLLTVGVVSGLARSVCRHREDVVPALVIALGAPVVAFQVASAKEDLLLVAAAAATALCLTDPRSVANLRGAGLFAGIAAGAKYPGAAIAAAAVAWPLFDRGGRPFRHAAIVALFAVFTGGLWYGLNVWRYGNPVAPFIAGAPGTLLDAAAVRQFVNSYGAGRSPLAFIFAPLHIFLEPGLFCGRANLYNPLVYAGLAGVWTAESRRRNGALLFIAAVLYIVWFATVQNARLLLPGVVLLAPAAAERLMPFVRRHVLLRGPAWGIAAVSLGIVAAVGAVRTVRYVTRPNDFLLRETQNYADIQWMNAHLDRQHARVASDHKALDHLEIPWLFLDPTYQLEIAPSEMSDRQRFLEACRRQGITHLFGTASSFKVLEASVRAVHRNDASRLGGVRFFREPPTEPTAVFEIIDGAASASFDQRPALSQKISQ